jgi:membrane protease YdiL (CAAX protease family)
MVDTKTSRRLLVEEVLLVLSLTFLRSAVFALIDVLTEPVEGAYRASVSQSPLFITQLAQFVFGLVPVWLVVHLLRRSNEGLETIGLDTDDPRRDASLGAALFAVIGIGGLAIYLGSVELGVNRFVVPVPPLGHWWTVPVLFMNAIEAALTEEVIVAAYLITRLQQLSWSPRASVVGSAALRGSYHLYQGWGGFLGNLAMGAIFGWLFARTKRAWPLVIAHFLIDVAAGIGFILFHDRLPGFS